MAKRQKSDGQIGGSRKPRLKTAERISIDTMIAAGKSKREIAKSLNRNVKTVRAYLQDARETLESYAEEYVEIHRIAAKNAAAKGDSRPAEWMMERTKIVEPATKTPESAGFTVKIGVILPGLGTTAQQGLPAGDTANALDAETIATSD